MRVLVVGSLPSGADPARDATYRQVCQDIGRAVAARGWTLNVGTDREDTADRLVVEGARATKKDVEVCVHYHDKEPIPFGAEANLEDTGATRGKGIRFTYAHGPGNWVSGRIADIQRCDFVLLIGGSDKTAQAFHTADALGKPVIPLPGCGGASGELWPVFVEKLHRTSLTASEMRSKVEPWRGVTSADCLLDLAATVVRQNPFAKVRKRVTALSSIVTVIATFTWALLFFEPFATSPISFFLVLLTSSFMGAGLHWAIAFIQHRTHNFDIQFSWPRAVAATIVSLGLFLLFLIGGLAINGDLTFFGNLENMADFQRMALVASIFGLGAGFLTETVSASLRKRLEPFAVGDKTLVMTASDNNS